VSFGVVEEKAELPASGPALHLEREAFGQRVCEHAERAKFRLNAIEIFDLDIDFLLFFERERGTGMVIGEHFDEQCQEIEIGFGFGRQKGLMRKAALCGPTLT